MKPILIGGVGRCGTTIIKNTLANHTHVMGLGTEMRWLADPHGLFHLNSTIRDSFSPPIVDRLWKEFKFLLTSDKTRSKYLGVFGEAYGYRMLDKLERSLFDLQKKGSKYHGWLPGPFHEMQYTQRHLVPIVLNAWVTELMEHRVQDFNLKDIQYWIDDTPENIWWFDEAHRIFVDPTCIHAVRHPYDILTSIWKRQKGTERPWWWPVDPIDIAKRIHNTLLICYEFPVHVIRLEDFVYGPDRLDDILGVLDLDFEIKIDRYIDTKLANTGRWKEELPKNILDTVRPILEPLARSWGYGDC